MSATLPLTIGFPARAPHRPRAGTPARGEVPAVPVAPRSGASHERGDPAQDIAAWVRHAEAANGFGGEAALESPLSYRLLRQARANRSASVGTLIAEAIANVAAAARQAHAWYRRRQDARTMRVGLHELDDRTLRDLGFTRSEIESVIAEATGAAEWTRLRTRWLHSQP